MGALGVVGSDSIGLRLPRPSGFDLRDHTPRAASREQNPKLDEMPAAAPVHPWGGSRPHPARRPTRNFRGSAKIGRSLSLGRQDARPGERRLHCWRTPLVVFWAGA